MVTRLLIAPMRRMETLARGRPEGRRRLSPTRPDAEALQLAVASLQRGGLRKLFAIGKFHCKSPAA
jgi:hypothetical protein